MRLTCSLTLLSLSLMLSSCANNRSNGDPDDAGPTDSGGDMDTSTLDAPSMDAPSSDDTSVADTGTDDAPMTDTGEAPVCSVASSNFGDVGALTGQATFSADTENEADYSIVMNATLENSPPSDVLVVEFYSTYPPFGTTDEPMPVVPGTYELTGDQLNYATCGVCVRLVTNVDEEGNTGDDYMVTGGTVTVSAVGDAVDETLTLEVSNLEFEHVTIDDETFESTPVGDSCTTAISGATFTGTVVAPAM